MAEEVAGALAAGRHLVVEAGTGVGKSLAYLVPAILWTTGAGPDDPPRRVVVSTFTRALQEQLSRKDLPLLERALAPSGVTVRHALLMGAENYLCVQRLDLAARAPRTPKAAERPDLVAALVRHAGSAPSGLRSEVPFTVPDDLWATVRRDSDACLGPRGPFWDACLYRRDLIRAREAEIVVVNHALFFLDLALGGRILPPHDAVILDEAHRAEEAAAAQFGATLGPASVARLLRDIAPAGRGARQKRRTRRDDGAADLLVRVAAAGVEEASGAFFAEVARVAADLAARRGRGARPGREDAAPRTGGPASVRLPPGALRDDRLRAPLVDLAEALDTHCRAATDPGDAAGLQALALRARDLGDRL